MEVILITFFQPYLIILLKCRSGKYFVNRLFRAEKKFRKINVKSSFQQLLKINAVNAFYFQFKKQFYFISL